MLDPRLSSLRGLAALWVVSLHAGGDTLPSVLGYVAGAGWLGVPIFFALSAYLLMGRLEADPSKKRYFVRRFKRIWPLYFGVLAATVLAFGLSPLWLVTNATFTSDLVTVAPVFVFWSLSVEEVAYVAFPFVHRLKTHQIAYVGLGGIAFAAAFLCVYPTVGNPALLSQNYASFYYLPPTWVGAYGAGLLAYAWKARGASAYALPAFFALGAAAERLPRALALVALSPLLIAGLPAAPSFLRWRVLVFVGEISFGIYLIHAQLIAAFGPVVGIALTLPAAAALEIPLRRKEIARRLRRPVIAQGPTPQGAAGRGAAMLENPRVGY